MKRSKIISKVLIFALWFLAAAHYSEAALFIDDTYTTDKGHIWLEFCLDYYKDKGKEFDASTYLSYGLTEQWDVGITLPYQFLDDSEGKVNGFSDLVIESKYRFWEEGKALPSYAFYFDLKSDSANDDKRLGTGKKDYTLNNIFTKNIGENVFDLNLGYILVGGKPDDIFFYSFDIARDITKRLNLCLEIYGETFFKGNFEENVFITAVSLSYQLNKMLTLESGVGFGISEASPDYQITHKLSFIF